MSEENLHKFESVRITSGEVLSTADGWVFDFEMGWGIPFLIASNPRLDDYAIPFPAGVECLIYARDLMPTSTERPVRAAAPPRQRQQQEPPPTEVEQSTGEVHVCPEHRVALRESKDGGWFCPKKVGKGPKDYCDYVWTLGDDGAETYTCPHHNIEMRESKDGGWFCPKKVGKGPKDYCEYTLE